MREVADPPPLVFDAAAELLEVVDVMLSRFAATEPERLERGGMRRLMSAALDLEDALAVDTSGLSDPAANTLPAIPRNATRTQRSMSLKALPRTGSNRMKVLKVIYDSGRSGMTHEEITKATGLIRNSAAPSCTNLKDGGWVHDSGRTRLTDQGCDAIVWVMTDAGVARYRELHRS